MLYYRVRVGFGPNDFLSIDQEDYPKAVIAQVTGKVAIFKNGQTISGSAIQSVLRDYGRSMGYKREYLVSEEDAPKELIKRFDEVRSNTQLEIENKVRRLN